MPIGTGIVYNVGDLILSQVSSSGTAFLETKIAAATSSLIYFDSTARINSASLNSITVGTASYVSGSNSIITNLTASNISASGTSSFGYVGIGTTSPSQKLHVIGDSIFNGLKTIQLDRTLAAAINSYTNIGNFARTHGAHSMIVSVTANISSYSVSKNYIINNAYNATGGSWRIALPITDSGPYNDDFQLLVNFDLEYCYLRLRKSSGSTYTGEYSITILYTGYTDTVFTATSTTGTDSSNLSILDSTQLVQIDGNVGIGTTSPAYKLDLQPTSSTARLGNAIVGAWPVNTTFALFGHNNLDHTTSATNYALIQWNDGTTYLNASSGKNINFRINNSDKMILNSSGQFGIGTTSPITGYLDVRSNQTKSVAGPTNIAFFGSSDGGNPLGLVVNHESSSGVKMVGLVGTEYGSSGNNIKINETLHVQYSGNVGIGTSSPGTKLNVVDSSPTIRLTDTNTNVTGGVYGAIDWLSSDSSVPGGLVAKIDILDDSGAYGDRGAIRFFTNNSTSLGERMRIDSSGNVGIGTTSTIAPLDVQCNTGGTGIVIRGRADNSTALRFYANNGTTQQLYIGTDDSNIDFVSVSTRPIRFFVNDLLQYQISQLGVFSWKDGAGGTRMTLNSTGLGIGTTSPAYLLDVSGSTRHGYRTADNHYFTGSVNISGSLNATASWANNVVSASYALSSSFTTTAQTANALNASNTYTVAGLTSAYVDVTGAGTIPTTGIYRPSTKTLGLSADGTLIFKISNVSSPATSSIETGNFIVSGSVGIGTTSPIQKLHIVGSTLITNNNYHYGYTVAGAQSNLIGISSADNIMVGQNNVNHANTIIYGGLGVIDLNTSGSTRMRVTYDGNVGIGTTSPGAKLELYNGNFKISDGNRIIFGASDPQIYGSSGVLTFRTNSTDKMYLDTNGNLGIGTSTPSSKLHISGSGQTILRIDSDTTTNIAQVQVKANGDGVLIAGMYGTASAGNNFGVTAASQAYVGTTTLNSGYPSSLVIGNVSSIPIAFSTNNTERMRIDGSGNVGIGTTSPVNKLQVAGNISGSSFTSSISNAVGFLGTSSWAQNVVSASYATTAQTANALNTGNSYTIAGLTNNGTLSQQGTLSMGSGYQILATTGTAPIPGIAFVGDTNTGIYSPSADTIGFSTSGSERVRIDSSGNVGIGTTNPLKTLQINAVTASIRLEESSAGSKRLELSIDSSAVAKISANQSGQQIAFETVGSERMRITSDGFVYIGTSSGIYGGTTTNECKLLVVGEPPSTDTDRGLVSFIDSRAYNTSGLRSLIALGTSYTSGGSKTFLGGIAALKENTTDGNYAGALALYYRANGAGLSEGLRIKSDGYVGIGTTTIDNKLSVGVSSPATLSNGSDGLRITDGTRNVQLLRLGSTYSYAGVAGSGSMLYSYDKLNIVADTTNPIIFNTGGGERMRISSDGNVGIGTTTVNYRLEVYNSGAENVAKFRGTNDSTIIIGGSDAGGSGEQYITYQNLTTATNAWMVGMDDGEDFRFAYGAAGEITDGNTLVKIDQNGNVGIGTVTPTAKLEITGSSNSALLNIKSPISGAILYVSGSGAVGIGTSAVGAFTLQVSGSFGATTKSFIIDHPTKEGKKLMYGSLESPYHGIRLTGRDTIKDGKCKVELPDYMYKLILHDSINIQLTGIKCNKTLYVDEINIPENYFTIAYDKGVFESYKDYDFFWDFTAIRADVPELNTEL